MQPRTDLSFLQFTEIGFRRIQTFVDQARITFEIVLGREPQANSALATSPVRHVQGI